MGRVLEPSGLSGLSKNPHDIIKQCSSILTRLVSDREPIVWFCANLSSLWSLVVGGSRTEVC